ncbi:HemK2/MTQ2 family protein methyltransferase [Streptomyces sp. CB01881]|uniref:HemK2/MTQ2 family protein methyltransferase n=1 Tax=Streptomyces sp. CB01881 TaxID=2078691 RepID=UPI000CDC6905|nr:HemK2/MTQ2 family protein methyltransferase [Streptomyces sp. CB01881]AUY47793.1 methyltransferase [Streptomyces sp. CB01881]TYC76269.1 methyltransferase domain-containing protein [Streptomyces sp. CB01881]
MLLIRPPGVYPPQGDTDLLVACVRREELDGSSRVLDLGTGTGAVALAAAAAGARVTAVDLSARAVVAAWLNSRLRLHRIRLRRGDLARPVAGRRFDLITANPPYVPTAEDPRPGATPGRGAALAWDAGPDGRLLLDRICREAPRLLAAGGVLLFVQSSLSDVHASLAALRAAGLRAAVVARRRQAFGPVMTARAALFERRGLIGPGEREEELTVVRGVRDE